MSSSRDALTTEEIDRLLQAGGPAHSVWLLLAADAGLRNAEIRSVTPDHVVASGLLYVRGKGHVRRTVPLTTRLADALRQEDLHRLQSRTPEERPYVLVGARGLQRRFRKLARQADVYLPGRCVHTLRHSYATRLIDAGVGLHVVQRLLGHASVQTTSIYLHASRIALARAARKLERFDGSLSPAKANSRRRVPGQRSLFRPSDPADQAARRRTSRPP